MSTLPKMSPIALVRDNATVRRAFIVVSWLTLLVGLVVYLHVRSEPSARPAAVSPAPQTPPPEARYGKVIPVPPAAIQTIRSFITNAVLRENLDAAWHQAAPALRGGLTKEQWMTGTIPVAQFPASAFAKASYKVVSSREKQIMLKIFIFPAKGSKVPGWDYYATLVPRDGRWLVSYFQTRGHTGFVPKDAG